MVEFGNQRVEMIVAIRATSALLLFWIEYVCERYRHETRSRERAISHTFTAADNFEPRLSEMFNPPRGMYFTPRLLFPEFYIDSFRDTELNIIKKMFQSVNTRYSG